MSMNQTEISNKSEIKSICNGVVRLEWRKNVTLAKEKMKSISVGSDGEKKNEVKRNYIEVADAQGIDIIAHNKKCEDKES